MSILGDILLEQLDNGFDKLVQRGKDNFEKRLLSPLKGNYPVNVQNVSRFHAIVEINSEEIARLNTGFEIPERQAKRAKAMRFKPNYKRGTKIGNLDSEAPSESGDYIFKKGVGGFKVKGGEWDKANADDLNEHVQEFFK